MQCFADLTRKNKCSLVFLCLGSAGFARNWGWGTALHGSTDSSTIFYNFYHVLKILATDWTIIKLKFTVMSSSATAATNEQQKIVNGFQKLRELQQATVSELSKIQSEQREHITVLKTIRTLEPERKCFRQVGDTLFEFTASELIIILEETIKRFKQRVDELEGQVVKIGEDINAYKEKHNIRFLTNKDVMEMQKKQAMAKISQLDLGSPAEKTAKSQH